MGGRTIIAAGAAALFLAVDGQISLGQQVAFSGADGAGAYVTGGRGGVVYHVTKLDQNYSDTGPGTLRYGVSDSNFKNPDGSVIPRTIVFDVGGTIWLGRFNTQDQGWDTQSVLTVGSNVTIAGQTAPGGITIAGGQLKMNGSGGTTPVSNSILRHVSILPGYGMRTFNSTTGYADSYTFDAINVNSSGVMIDHVSAAFATDETISANEFANNATVQYSTIAQGQNYPQSDPEVKIGGVGTYAGHALGSLWSPGSGSKTSLLHNLYAHMAGRLPTIQTETSKLTNGVAPLIDIRDNVIYNWFGNAGYGSSGLPSSANFVNNYYKVGPGGDSVPRATTASIVTAAGGTNVFSGSSSTAIYAAGNMRQNLNGTMTTLTASNYASGAASLSAAIGVPYLGISESAVDAYARVLAYVGANWQNRSAIDARLINEVQNGTGKITALDNSTAGYNSAGVYVTNGTGTDTEWAKMLTLRGGTAGTGGTGAFLRPANFDTDRDGMPDIWETAHALNPIVADNNGDYDSNGFTNLEEYLNELAAFPAPVALVFNNAGGTGRFAQIGNWQQGTVASTTGTWLPSRFDEAQIASGTATVDSVGQHAGVLKIATASGGSATLVVSGGWIDVARTLTIGSAGSGVVTQTAGLVRVGTGLTIGGTGTTGRYDLAGGTLATPLLSRTSTGTFNFTGGVLHADRVAFGFTNNGGTISPGGDLALQLLAAAGFADSTGDSPSASTFVGQTQVNGDLTLTSGAVQIDLASATVFDRLIVDGKLTLGGALQVSLLDGYVPAVGDRWLIGSAGTIDGTFAAMTAGFGVETSGGSLFLVSVPEPMSAVLVLPGLLILRRRRN